MKLSKLLVISLVFGLGFSWAAGATAGTKNVRRPPLARNTTSPLGSNSIATPYLNVLAQQNRTIDAILRTLPPDAVAEGLARGPAWNPAPPISQEWVRSQLRAPFERMPQNDPAVRESERAMWNALGGTVEFKGPRGEWGRLPIPEVQPNMQYYGCPGIPQPIPGNDSSALGGGCVPMRQLR